MENKPFFSVIIPTLNEARYLPRLLTALSKQTYKDFEIIVVDAHSEDKTGEVVKEFALQSPDIHCIDSHKCNLPFQRNLGAKEARGEFLVFFDADVVIPAEFLEKIHQVIVSRKLSFLTTWIKTAGCQICDQLILTLLNIGVELSIIIGKPHVYGPNIIVRQDIFSKVKGYNENITLGEDYDFSLRVYQAGYRLAVLKDPRWTMSMRRFYTQGRLKVLYQWMLASINIILGSSVRDESVDYQMGGHIYR